MSDATCKTCPYWSPYPARDDSEFRDGMGDCRRHAPTMVATRAEDPRDPADFNSLFPYTVADEWCGSHPDRQPHLECATTTLVTAETDGPTAADMRRIVDALEKMATRAARAKP